jgi:hypothetical protein
LVPALPHWLQPWFRPVLRFRGSLLLSSESFRLIPSGLITGLAAATVAAQGVPPAAIDQFQQVVGNRVEAVTILGGDYGAAGGLYTFRGGRVADLSVSKIGGGGDVAEKRPLGIGDLEWAPVLLGNLGYISAKNEFESGVLQGNELRFDTLAVQGGFGARFYFTEGLSLAPTIGGIYGYTENEFLANNAFGQAIKSAASGQYVDWDIDTWSVVPGVELKYTFAWKRIAFELDSRYEYFHTETFDSTSPLIKVQGDSQTWENKLDVDAPLGLKFLGRELHTGGFVSRTELFGGAAEGLDANHLYTFNGRLVLDLLGAVWKVRWVGLGFTYFLADQFSGWSAGVDLKFRF